MEKLTDRNPFTTLFKELSGSNKHIHTNKKELSKKREKKYFHDPEQHVPNYSPTKEHQSPSGTNNSIMIMRNFKITVK